MHLERTPRKLCVYVWGCVLDYIYSALGASSSVVAAAAAAAFLRFLLAFFEMDLFRMST